MIDSSDVRSAAEFELHFQECIQSLKGKKDPMVLTVDGHAEIIVQDAASYQELLDRLETAEAASAIRQGLRDIEEGRVYPALPTLAQLGKKLGISG